MPAPLIPRARLFGNPNRLAGTISPDGSRLAWVAPLDGVLNIWTVLLHQPADARPLTRDTKRGVRDYYWAYDGRHLLFLQDRDGDENWRLHAVDVGSGEIRPLTPEGARATPAGASRHVRGAVLVTHNQRDPRYPDLYRVEIATGETTLVAENPGFAGFLSDDRFVPRLALRSTPDGGMDMVRPAPDGTGRNGAMSPPRTSSPPMSATSAPTAIRSICATAEAATPRRCWPSTSPPARSACWRNTRRPTSAA